MRRMILARSRAHVSSPTPSEQSTSDDPNAEHAPDLPRGASADGAGSHQKRRAEPWIGRRRTTTFPLDEKPTGAASATAEDGAALPRLALPVISYCVTADEAASAVEAVVRDARGWPVGLDIETAAHPAEQARLKALTLSLAAAKGKLAALKKAKASAADIKTAAKEAKALDARRKMAGQAALDPHRSSIRLVQLYGGGDKVYVIDIARAGQAALRLLDGLNVVAHNAQFELKHLEHAGVELGEIHCTMQAARLLLGERRMSLADACRRLSRRRSRQGRADQRLGRAESHQVATRIRGRRRRRRVSSRAEDVADARRPARGL